MIFRLIYAALAVLAIAGIARAEAIDALDEVNQQRAARGLRPYVRDAGLTAGAMNVASFRAARLIAGHTASDFAGLPMGVTAGASGCAALEPFCGFGACAMFEHWTFAGAAKIMGRDGKFYCQLFVNGPASSTERISNAPLSVNPARSVPVRRRR